jgi:hypothetical protein
LLVVSPISCLFSLAFLINDAKSLDSFSLDEGRGGGVGVALTLAPPPGVTLENVLLMFLFCYIIHFRSVLGEEELVRNLFLMLAN